MSLFFAHHRLGLRMRAAGENPAGLVAGGVDPRIVRLYALIGCGMLCGLAGAQLSIANVTLFVENMSAGRGWIAVVAVLLTRGNPLAILAIAVIFGSVDSLSFRVQGFRCPAAIYRHDALSRDTCRADRAVLVAQVAPGPILGDPT